MVADLVNGDDTMRNDLPEIHETITADDVVRELEQVEIGGAVPAQGAYVPNNPYAGIASGPFPEQAIDILLQEIPEDDVEIRPDGLIYLPEIKYRRILNRAFGPGAWSVLPKEITISDEGTMLYYRGALFVYGRFVSEAIGEQPYSSGNDRMSYATAAEAAKSNCLMRCCKDLGIASELWDPSFIRRWIARHAVAVWCTNVGSNPGDKGKKRKMWRKKTAEPLDMFPWREEAERDMAIGQALGSRGSSTPQGSPQGQGASPAADVQAPMTSSGGGTSVISYKQSRRFLAIARDRDWKNDEIRRLLASYGFTNPEEITRAEYERICAALESPTIHAELRDDLDHENAGKENDFVPELPF